MSPRPGASSFPRSMGDLPGHTMAMHPLARTKPSGQMYVGCHCPQDAAYVNSVRLNF